MMKRLFRTLALLIQGFMLSGCTPVPGSATLHLDLGLGLAGMPGPPLPVFAGPATRLMAPLQAGFEPGASRAPGPRWGPVAQNAPVIPQPGAPAAPDSSTAADQLQQRIVKASKGLAALPSFPYAPGTGGRETGSLGCANVVSKALCNAGVLGGLILDCWQLRDHLKEAGWSVETRSPAYRSGDVVFWSTYDWNQDGTRDADTHTGIIVRENGRLYVMHNGRGPGGEKKPVMERLSDVPYTITTVLRSPTLA